MVVAGLGGLACVSGQDEGPGRVIGFITPGAFPITRLDTVQAGVAFTVTVTVVAS